MSDTLIQTALEALPIWGTGESIIVVRNPTTPPSYVLTFESKRGKYIYDSIQFRHIYINKQILLRMACWIGFMF